VVVKYEFAELPDVKVPNETRPHGKFHGFVLMFLLDDSPLDEPLMTLNQVGLSCFWMR
jgi:hypothetical protein